LASNIEEQVVSVGRFSSQVLNYRGAEKKVRVVNDQLSNTFDNSSGDNFAPEVGSLSLGNFGLVSGSVKSVDYYTLRSYFLNRGTGVINANALALLVIDSAKIMNISPRKLLERSLPSTGKIRFAEDVMLTINYLRSTGNQIGTATSVNNHKSPQSRNVKA
jgi:hypothetical protein